jgi:hypothetical protein
MSVPTVFDTLPVGKNIISLADIMDLDSSLCESSPMLYSLYLHANQQYLTQLQKQFLQNLINVYKAKRDAIDKLNCDYLCDAMPDHVSEEYLDDFNQQFNRRQ